MKTTIFNFLVLQVIVWAIVFSSGFSEDGTEINYAFISDTWQVANVGEKYEKDLVLQYPTFNKLTLNIDGTYVRVRNDDSKEQGSWTIDRSKSVLLLSNESEIKKYEIIQLPEANAQSFIIKEKGAERDANNNLEYELTRL